MSGTRAGFATGYAESLISGTEMVQTGSFESRKKTGFDRNGGVLSLDNSEKVVDLGLVLWSD